MGNQKGSTAIVVIMSLATLSVIGFAGWYVVDSNNEKDEAISSLNEDLDTAKSDLVDAENKVEELDSPERKARDQQRKNDLNVLAGALANFVSNNNGRFPSTEPTSFNSEFALDFFDSEPDFKDPNTGNQYTITPVANVQTPPGLVIGDIQYQSPGKCAGSEFDDDASAREAAVRVLLESSETYCIDV